MQELRTLAEKCVVPFNRRLLSLRREFNAKDKKQIDRGYFKDGSQQRESMHTL
jgi:hypothetical protein